MVRVAYDRTYVYMQIKWTEVAGGSASGGGSFEVGADVSKDMWRYASSGSQWSQSGGEGSALPRLGAYCSNRMEYRRGRRHFDGVDFRTAASGERADLWAWLATQTNYTGYLADKVVGYAASGDGSSFDLAPAPAFVLANPDTLGRPTYMKSGSRTSGSSYPLRSYEFTRFDTRSSGRMVLRYPDTFHLCRRVLWRTCRRAPVSAATHGRWSCAA